MAIINISVPVFRKDKWNALTSSGEISISSASIPDQPLVEAYQTLKVEVAELLEFVNAENKILSDHSKLLEEVNDTQNKLTRLKDKVAVYNTQLRRLTSFFDRIGVKGSDSFLRIYEESNALLASVYGENDEDQEHDGKIPEF